MDDILRGIDFCFTYLDDILVFSQSLKDHEHHLRTLYDRLETNGILINPAKCVFKHPKSLSSVTKFPPGVPDR
jgi:hypothetical protein